MRTTHLKTKGTLDRLLLYKLRQVIGSTNKMILALLGLLALSTVSLAEKFEFRLVFPANGPGIAEYLVGDLDSAIRILEESSTSTDNYQMPDTLATLCALYVLQGRYDTARDACDNAVKSEKSDVALNNRGVLRMNLGDVDRAREDFGRARIRPDDMQSYIEELAQSDERVIASNNFDVVTDILEKQNGSRQADANSMKGATIEDINP